MKKNKQIFLHPPYIKGNEWTYVKECLNSGWISKGKYNNIFEQKIANFTRSKYTIACINGTSALQISLKIVGVLADDEVIVPTITFIAPVNAIKYNGANPIFMDVDDFHNLDADKTIQFLKNETVFKSGFTYNKKTSRRISAIIPVHTWGNAANLEELLLLCQERNIAVVEDASESLGTTYINGSFSKKHTGTIGLVGCLSFNVNKIITSGGGGMILTENDKIAETARYLVNQAKDDTVWYKHNEVGYNYRLSNINASLGVAQFEKLEEFLAKKKSIHQLYVKGFDDIEGISVMEIPQFSNSNYWLNILKFDNKYPRQLSKIINDLNNQAIQTRPVWHPNHLQKPYINCQTYKIEKAQKIISNSLCVPSGIDLREEDIKLIIKYFDE